MAVRLQEQPWPGFTLKQLRDASKALTVNILTPEPCGQPLPRTLRACLILPSP